MVMMVVTFMVIVTVMVMVMVRLASIDNLLIDNRV